MKENWIYFLLMLVPPLVCWQLFKKHWVDIELKRAAIYGFVFGWAAVFVTRLLYFPIEWFIGSDLRTFLLTPRPWWIKLLVCIGIIGFIEEAVKAGGGMVAAFVGSFLKRPSIVFMGFLGCGAGFSFLENVQYYIVYGPEVVLPRIFISSSAHLFFSALCAAIVAKALTRPKAESIISARILAAVLISGILHGLFDFMLISLEMLAVAGIVLSISVIHLLGIYEAWIVVLKLDDPKESGLMICSGCGAFSLGRARFCNFCGSRVLISNKDFSVKVVKPGV